jgi:sterol desaturase/sphingolipid hydroxylase (fatty acid hydroxylase superfamily)
MSEPNLNLSTSWIVPPGNLKAVVVIACLTLFWCWETWFPFFERGHGRGWHALRNLGLALCNAVVLGALFGTVTVQVAGWTYSHRLGLLNLLSEGELVRWSLAFLLLDAWMYVWHRANHTVPLLWRFHRMHHSDERMDVTTATRFHLGEQLGSSLLRLLLIPLLGLEVGHLLVYDALVIAATNFHHANLGLGRLDSWLRWLIVTPDMHRIHHSLLVRETNSNYATVLSLWDRLAGSFRMRRDQYAIRFGVAEFNDPRWQTWWGMWRTPFVDPEGESRKHERRKHEKEGHKASRIQALFLLFFVFSSFVLS